MLLSVRFLVFCLLSNSRYCVLSCLATYASYSDSHFPLHSRNYTNMFVVLFLFKNDRTELSLQYLNEQVRMTTDNAFFLCMIFEPQQANKFIVSICVKFDLFTSSQHITQQSGRSVLSCSHSTYHQIRPRFFFSLKKQIKYKTKIAALLRMEFLM